MTTFTPETAAAPIPMQPQLSLASPALIEAWDLAKASLRMAIFTPFEEARRMHGATANAAVRLVQSLSGGER